MHETDKLAFVDAPERWHTNSLIAQINYFTLYRETLIASQKSQEPFPLNVAQWELNFKVSFEEDKLYSP